MEFQQDCPKDKKITTLLIFWWKTEKFRSTEHYGAPLEGSTIFLCRSSLGCTSIDSCQLADLKYAIFSSTGCKTKKLPRSKLFLSMVFKHGLLKGSTFLFQYSFMTSAPLESCRLPELKYAIFSRTGRKTKKLPRSKLFLSMAFKHGLLEGSAFLFQYSSITRAPLESCR